MSQPNRRHFLKSTAALSAAFGLPAFASGTSGRGEGVTVFRTQDGIFLSQNVYPFEKKELLANGESLNNGATFSGKELFSALENLDSENTAHFMTAAAQGKSAIYSDLTS